MDSLLIYSFGIEVEEYPIKNTAVKGYRLMNVEYPFVINI